MDSSNMLEVSIRLVTLVGGPHNGATVQLPDNVMSMVSSTTGARYTMSTEENGSFFYYEMEA